MKQLLTFLLFLCISFCFSISSEELNTEDCNREWICLLEVEDEHGVELFIRNKNQNPNAATSIKLDAILTNLTPSNPLPVYTVIRGNEPRSVLKLEYKEKGKYAFRSFSYRVRPGDWDSQHDDSVTYQLPFGPEEKIRISQGYNGKITHKGQFAYALDFLMDMGTPIYAARDGFVVATEDRFKEGGFRPDLISKANFIIIQHSDGTLANYAHLQQKGVLVNPGDTIIQGQLIGYSGNTGYTQGPHLHFEVHKPNKNFEVTTIPTVFTTQYKSRDILKPFYLYWHPKWGESPPSFPIDAKDIYLCRISKSLEKEFCGTTEFTLGENILIYLQFLQPGSHQIRVEVFKEDGTLDPIKIDWKSKEDNLYEGRYFELRPNPEISGKWVVKFSINGVNFKSISFLVR